MEVARTAVDREQLSIAVDDVDALLAGERHDRLALRHPDREEEQREATARRSTACIHLRDEATRHLLLARRTSTGAERVHAVLEQRGRGRPPTERPGRIRLRSMTDEASVAAELAAGDL